MRRVSRSCGAVAEPIVKICLPSVFAEPAGASALSASAVKSGMSSVPVSRIGAPMGCAARLAAAIPEAQSLSSTRLTAAGPGTPPADGNAARATPAASATGSRPATRVVFLVANAGKPRSWRGRRLLLADDDARRRCRLLLVVAQRVDQEVGADADAAEHHQDPHDHREASSPVGDHEREHTGGV